MSRDANTAVKSGTIGTQAATAGVLHVQGERRRCIDWPNPDRPAKRAGRPLRATP
jgi:hypothetical protein